MTATEARKAQTTELKALTGGRKAAASVRTTDALVSRVQGFGTAPVAALEAAGYRVEITKAPAADMYSLTASR